MSINSIENLSNEFFVELFDYLDGIDIYNAFSNLNHRFQQLLNSSFLLFKIKIDSPSDELYTKIYEQLILLNKRQIYSFYLCISSHNEQFFSSFSIDSSLDHLESLILSEIESTILIQLLSKLTYLSRLFSLTIDMLYDSIQLTDIYQLIFALPKLKYLKFSTEDSDINISLPFSLKNQFSTIEYLIINHSCTFNELSAILSYTPQLSRLNFAHTNDNNSIITNILPIRLSNLSYISLNVHYIKFDEFIIFIKNLDCKLQILHFTTWSEDMTYLDANRWEELILKYLPQLEKFYFQYYEQIYNAYDSSTYLENFNHFISSFWIEKKWIFETEMDSFELIYRIHPYKERWYDINSSIEYSKSTQLIFTYSPCNEYSQLSMIDIHGILRVAQFYHLDIEQETIDFITLMDIIYILSELDSLKIYSLSLSPRTCSSTEKILHRFISNKNQIRKIYLEQMNEIEEVYFLIKFCPRINYLQINNINTMDIELFIKKILYKINNDCNQYLYTLCLRIPTVDDRMLEKLKDIINSNKLLVCYTIKRVFDVIYLQWKNDYHQDLI
ncbi:unnamed protein product [Rotaria sp. Silwood1]|nr:unnamed protein product [Rotaria sp. Silwood1]